MYYFIKILLSAIIIVCISEISKRSTHLGSLLASIPLVSVVSIIWIYLETKDIDKIINLSSGIFWLVIPSLLLFVLLHILLKLGLNFYFSMFLSICCTICFYLFVIRWLDFFNFKG